MALQKQNISINFAKGLDTKSDPKQISPGNFLALQNMNFGTTGLLKKRNGFGDIVSVSNASTLTTFNDGLLALGTQLSAYSSDNESVVNAGSMQPLTLTTSSLVRSATSQTNVDMALTSSGLCCSVWLDSDTNCYYQISDSITGQTVVPKVQLPSTATIARVSVLGPYFIITFLATVSATTHLQYISIPILNPSSPSAAVDLSTQVNTLAAGYDVYVFNNRLYISWVSNTGGNVVKASYLTAQLVQGGVATITGETGNLISVTADASTGNVWISIYKSAANTIRVTALNPLLTGTVLAPTTAVSAITINELTSVCVSMTLTLFYEVANTYSYTPNAKSDYISKNTVTQAGSVGTPAIILRGVGLSKQSYVLHSLLKELYVSNLWRSLSAHIFPY
jgi:hypothetical protein